MSNGEQHHIILGGGIAGLVSGYELSRRGFPVTVLERNVEVGGLARTLEYEGFRFDIGGHRFHSNNPEVVNYLKDLLGSDLLQVGRQSHIRLNNRYVHYPIQFPDALLIFPPHVAARMLFSYIWAQIRHSNTPDISFEDWVVKRFGRELYDVYFKPYTEKVWGIKTTELSSMWAEQRLSIPNLLQTIRHALFPSRQPAATAVRSFYYPREGFGMISQHLQQLIESCGGSVIGGATVKRVDPNTGTVTYERDGQSVTLEGERIISTLPLNLLLKMLTDPQASVVADQNSLTYRDLIVVYVALKTKQVSKDSWTYFPSPDLIFGRTHEPKNWSRELVPSDDFTSLAVEIFTTRGEPVWNMTDEQIGAKVADQLSEIGFIRREDVYRTWTLRVPFAYPVYYIGYEEKMKRVLDYLKRYPNLYLVGRTGSFQYMNSDGVIEDVFRLMGELLPTEPASVHRLAVESERWA